MSTNNQDRKINREQHSAIAREVTPAQPRMRKLLSGRTVTRATVGRLWHDLILPGPGATGGRSADPRHPSRKHDVPRPQAVVTPSAQVTAREVGQPRRRDRRALIRHQVRHHEISGSIGGGDYASECACGVFFTAPTGPLLREVTVPHYTPVSA